MRPYRHHPPPWWPTGEPWPPRHRRQWRPPSHALGASQRFAGRFSTRRRGRRFFLIRLAALLVIVLALSAFGAVTLLMTAFGRGSPGQLSGYVLWAVVPALFVYGLVLTMRLVGQPLSDVVAAADRVASGDFGVRVLEHGPPWLRSVAAAFNSMTTRLESQQRQRRDLMADVAHELRTPLAVMQGRLEGMLDGVYPRDERQVAQVLDDTRTLARLVEDLRTLAHSESGTLALATETTDLNALLDETVAAFAPEAASHGVDVQLHLPADLPLIEIDPLRIREVVTNLLSNAVRYSRPGGTVRLDVEAGPRSVSVRVADHGVGIPAEELPHIFDRFYKGSASKGSGLGLTIARSLVTAHNGSIKAESDRERGTTIVITLPMTPSPGDTSPLTDLPR